MLVEILGFVAGLFTTFGFLPQIGKLVRTKSAQDISLPTVIVLLSGNTMWLVYGLLSGSRPVIAANFVTVCMLLTLLVLSYRYRHKPK